MAQVAVFDFDRTLIAGSSAQVFGRALRDVGVSIPTNPGQTTYFRLYERFGEDPVTMRVARYAPRLFKGARVGAVETAGKLAADVLASRLLAPARRELDRHRQEATLLLLATTAPSEVARPFAAAVGFDDVVCTRYRSADDVYDGTTDGVYMWGDDKAESVAAWAGERSVDLNQSSAYSDSWYDLPLLELVGHPVAVNADLRLGLRARAKNWPRRTWAG